MRDQPLTYTSAPGQREGTTILKLVGPLTLENLFSFQQDLTSVGSQVLILDLSESDYMDSAGLGVLLKYYVSAEKRGRKLLLASVNNRVKALLEITHVEGILKSFPTPADAEGSL